MKWRECETAVDGLLRLGDGKVQGGGARVFVSMCRWMAQGAKTHSPIVQQGFSNFEATAVYTSAPKGPILPPSMYSFCYFHPVLLPARFGRQLTAHSVFLCAGPSFSGIDSGFGLMMGPSVENSSMVLHQTEDLVESSPGTVHSSMMAPMRIS